MANRDDGTKEIQRRVFRAFLFMLGRVLAHFFFKLESMFLVWVVLNIYVLEFYLILLYFLYCFYFYLLFFFNLFFCGWLLKTALFLFCREVFFVFCLLV